MREFHSVSPSDTPPVDGSQGFGPVPLSTYETHLDFLVNLWRGNHLWTDNPTTIIKYRHARSACTASVNGSTIEFNTSNTDCTRFATPISVIVRTANDVSSIVATQGGQAVSTRKLDSQSFSVTADPTLGNVELAGCADEGHVVDKTISLPAVPNPAASVCDIETVRGSGSPGKMDDLERSAEEFQILPNPAQEDGRTGSWSWYPQIATVEIAQENQNSVLRYAGQNLNAWTGASLAFLGGNGAGTCYDASQYRGLRFKIKGNVTSSDNLNGKVIVSLVTAETQTQVYGGDLDGEGGHFNKQIDVTNSWQTVSIEFNQLDRPTWGATTSLSSPAVGKLQAIDWGISNTASTFEVLLDDIELF